MGLHPLKSLSLQHWPGPAQGVSGCGLSSIINFTFGEFCRTGCFFFFWAWKVWGKWHFGPTVFGKFENFVMMVKQLISRRGR